MMNLVCVGLIGLCVVLWSEYREAVKQLNRAYDMTDDVLDSVERYRADYDELEAKYNELSGIYKETKQRLDLYDYLLTDTEIAMYRLGSVLVGNADEDELKVVDDLLVEISKEYRALQNGETTGRVYTADGKYDAQLLEGYKLINNNWMDESLENYEEMSDEEYLALRAAVLGY